MEIQKESMCLKEHAIKTRYNLLCENTLIVPDLKPDILELLLGDCTASLTSYDVRNGCLSVSGTVNFSALYRPDETEPALELIPLFTSFAFSDTLDLPKAEGVELSVSVRTEHVGVTLLNSRKLSVKVLLVLSVDGYKERECTPIVSLSGDGAHVRTKQVGVHIPSVHTASFTVKDMVSVLSSQPEPCEIVRVSGKVISANAKAAGDRVIVTGALRVDALYATAEDERLLASSHEIPFTEMVEARGVTENSHALALVDVQGITADIGQKNAGDNTSFVVTAQLFVKITAGETKTMTIADDCYSTCFALQKTSERIQFLELIGEESNTLQQAQTVEFSKNERISEVLSSSAKAIVRETAVKDGEVLVSGTLISFLLCRTLGDDGKIVSAVTETPFTFARPAHAPNCTANVNVCVQGVSPSVISENTVELLVTLFTATALFKEHSMEILTDATALSDSEVSQNPSLTVCFLQVEECLWDIAKRYKTTVEKIKAANNLDNACDHLSTFPKHTRLLIPRAS